MEVMINPGLKDKANPFAKSHPKKRGGKVTFVIGEETMPNGKIVQERITIGTDPVNVDKFKNHPMLRAFLDSGKLVEVGAVVRYAPPEPFDEDDGLVFDSQESAVAESDVHDGVKRRKRGRPRKKAS